MKGLRLSPKELLKQKKQEFKIGVNQISVKNYI